MRNVISGEKVERRIEEALVKLEEVQKRTSARQLAEEDLREIVWKALEVWGRNLSVLPEKKYFRKVKAVMYWTVPMTYDYPAAGTLIEVTITRHGKITIVLERSRAIKEPYGGLKELLTPTFD